MCSLFFFQLGLLRTHVTKPHVKTLLLNEMMSRAIKCTLQMLMRKKMEQIRVPSEEPYRRLVIDYFNVLLGKRPESDMYWKIEMKVYPFRNVFLMHHWLLTPRISRTQENVT